MAAVARTGMKPAQLNGAPAVVLRVELDDAWSGRIAPRTVMSVDTDERGKITRIYSVMAPRKLTAVGS